VCCRAAIRGHTHRDGVRFADGREVLLQSINEVRGRLRRWQRTIKVACSIAESLDVRK
jgi:hypothetical protein